MDSKYKLEKEAFVSGMTGSSITHVCLVSSVALSSMFLYAALRTRLPESQKFGFILSWILLVLPLLLSLTLFAERPILLNAIIIVPASLLLLLPKREGPSPLPSKQDSTATEEDTRVSRIPPLPALTTYRSHMMLMTTLAILAVDFPIFPRSLAKCETFGVSLMDLGVGSFVYAQGMMAARPLLRDPRYLTAPWGKKVYTVTRKCLPIILLGVGRVISVKGTEYPEHVTEYGVHWNFFITLALLPILEVMLHPVFQYLPISLVGVLVALGQQLALSYGLKDYVLNAPSTSLISQNKEGLVSLTGYFAVYLLGLSAGTIVLPPSPNHFSRKQEALAKQSSKHGMHTPYDAELDLSAPRKLDKTATELASYAIIWWVLLGFTKLFKVDGTWGSEGGMSRRIVNLPYIMWVAAYNVFFVLAYIVLLDVIFFPGPKTKKPKTPTKEPHSPTVYRRVNVTLAGNPPKLLDDINKHSLSIFLLANVSTGVINFAMKTMYASTGTALLVLSGYASVICAVAWFWDKLSKKRKVD
ncbi:hypothetical protein FA15DRAFT_612475 [Coprinopsis marcescibilis]|uniref:GPI-anchored wall transfer protein n=1 Tax=Coprinopsis marcescibilis TaxID=230819 RepID=A0A5C3L6I4_COPMA|nr:hypothetical protein FA15DRAFT_612475 [Coprinopsis marcescibilis]